MSARTRIRSLTLAAAAASFALLGCGDGLEFSNDSLPAPSLALAATPATCSGVGGGQILFAIDDLRVTENFPFDVPQNRIDIEGTLVGLDGSEQVAILILPATGACPILSKAVATVDAGSFRARGDFLERRSFSAVVVAHSGTLDDLSCDSASGCLSTAAGGFAAVSATVEVRLD